ncbi:MAG: serine protease [Candidatus Omnitrophica bacterium]|nr:serine protease [Candidatus Omnitrophota bacterium]
MRTGSSIFFNYCVLFFLSLSATPVFAQTSFIDQLLHSQKSLVSIRALKTQIYGQQQTEAAIDKKSGKILVAEKAKASLAEKNGAGVIIDPSGLIVTNLHVIYGADKIAVIFHNQTQVSAQVVELNPAADLALLKVKPPFHLEAVSFADSNRVRLRDEIINIGHSELLHKTISGGKISGIGTRDGRGNIELIQVNMNLYKGDSGGPLFDHNGRLIGMITAKNFAKDKTSYAIPSNKIRELYHQHFQTQ